MHAVAGVFAVLAMSIVVRGAESSAHVGDDEEMGSHALVRPLLTILYS